MVLYIFHVRRTGKISLRTNSVFCPGTVMLIRKEEIFLRNFQNSEIIFAAGFNLFLLAVWIIEFYTFIKKLI